MLYNIALAVLQTLSQGTMGDIWLPDILAGFVLPGSLVSKYFSQTICKALELWICWWRLLRCCPSLETLFDKEKLFIKCSHNTCVMYIYQYRVVLHIYFLIPFPQAAPGYHTAKTIIKLITSVATSTYVDKIL